MNPEKYAKLCNLVEAVFFHGPAITEFELNDLPPLTSTPARCVANKIVEIVEEL